MYASRLAPAVALGLSLLLLAACSKPGGDAGAAAGAPAASAPKVAGVLPQIGPAPVWRLQDVTGKPLSSEDLKGKVVVVDFWATWCPPCREEIPGYIELQKKYGPEGVVIVGISLDQGGPDVVKPFAAKYGINYPLVMGDEKVVADFGGVEGIPTTFLIDRNGQIRDRKVGMEAKAVYEQKIVALLAEKA